jgi:hypothetical protein
MLGGLSQAEKDDVIHFIEKFMKSLPTELCTAVPILLIRSTCLLK